MESLRGKMVEVPADDCGTRPAIGVFKNGAASRRLRGYDDGTKIVAPAEPHGLRAAAHVEIATPYELTLVNASIALKLVQKNLSTSLGIPPLRVLTNSMPTLPRGRVELVADHRSDPQVHAAGSPTRRR